jgi:hypothetical protein
VKSRQEEEALSPALQQRHWQQPRHPHPNTASLQLKMALTPFAPSTKLAGSVKLVGTCLEDEPKTPLTPGAGFE